MTDLQDFETPLAPVAPVETAEDPHKYWVPAALEEGLTVHHVSPYSDLGDKAERFVYETYRVSGFCEVSPRKWVEETDPWREGSELHVVCEGEEVLGVLRTILGRFEDLPASQFEPEIDIPSGLLCEGASLAVATNYRGIGVANELHKQLFQYGVTHGAQGFCLLIDGWMADFLRELYAFPVRVFSTSKHYMGGDIEPIGIWMDELLETFPRRRPSLYKHAISGLTASQIVELDLPIVLD